MQPDDFWFVPPSNVTCNTTQYCRSPFNYESSCSSDSGIDGQSSEEFHQLCDEISNNGCVFIEPGAYDTSTTDCDDTNTPSKNQKLNNDAYFY